MSTRRVALEAYDHQDLSYERLVRELRPARGHSAALFQVKFELQNVPRAALLRVRKGVDFDAPDDAPVLLFCALIVDTEAADEHLRIFADLVSLINEEAVKDQLLQAADVDTVLSILSHPAHPTHPAHAT